MCIRDSSNPAELVAKTAAITAELKAKDKEIERLTQKLADVQVDGLFGSAQEIGGVKFAMAGFTGTKPDALKTMADRIKEQAPNMVALLYTCLLYTSPPRDRRSPWPPAHWRFHGGRQ